MTYRKLSLAIASLTAAFATAPALAESPYLKPDDTWIAIDGEVESVSTDSFKLDYGQGAITVEMDDGDRDADAYKLMEGDEVTVSGIVDDNFYEVSKIEASSVFVESLGTYFYASAVDEEDTFIGIDPVVVSETVIQGKVSSVADATDEFTVDTGAQKLTVEVDEMTYDPLDSEGYQQIEKGDKVSITGNLDNDLFEGRVFEAETVTTLHDKKDAENS